MIVREGADSSDPAERGVNYETDKADPPRGKIDIEVCFKDSLQDLGDEDDVRYDKCELGDCESDVSDQLPFCGKSLLAKL